MGKYEKGTPKEIDNRSKSKGLQKLKLWVGVACSIECIVSLPPTLLRSLLSIPEMTGITEFPPLLIVDIYFSYCEMCEKQCRDQNGFDCHKTSESHQRQLLLFAENQNQYLNEFSKEFSTEFIKVRNIDYVVILNRIYSRFWKRVTERKEWRQMKSTKNIFGKTTFFYSKLCCYQ